jgi:uncharacterized damage-inducible protein DinB
MAVKLKDIFTDWEPSRKELDDMVKLLTDSQLDWFPERGKNSIGDLLRHISEAEHWWFGTVILGKDDYKDLKKDDAPDIESILKHLEKSHTLVEQVLKNETLDSWTEKKFRVEWRKEDLILRDIIWHVAEHEMRHRGQILMLMRLQGLEPPVI